MKRAMTVLAPKSVRDFESFKGSIIKYNNWFIKLRYFAVAAMVIFLFSLTNFFDITPFQLAVVAAVTVAIFVYNILLANLMKTEFAASYPVRVSLYQMIADLMSLSLLVYVTGGIETPIIMFFAFHMIIGSIILPNRIVYILAVTLFLSFSVLSFLEYLAVIPHMSVGGLYPEPLYNSIAFIVTVLTVFALFLYITILLTTRVVAELYEREGELKDAYDQLAKAEESKQKYIMAVVHELKSPIAAASSFLDLILGGFVGDISDDVRDKVGKAKHRTTESIETINSILKISKFRLLNKVEKEDVDLVEVADHIIESLQANADRKNITMEKKYDSPQLIYQGDKTLLQLSFSNLIGNAVKYTPKEGRVKVELVKRKNEVELDVTDSGIGIPEKEQEKIFNEFYRASNTKDHRIEGTGTGLSIVQEIIKTHGGKIEIESPSKIGTKENPGTTFKVKLPLQ